MSMYGKYSHEVRGGYDVEREALYSAAESVDASASEENGHGAVQSFAEECDINNIMAKFTRTGLIEWSNKYEGTYDDVSGVTFEACMDTVLKAQEMFDDLPSSVRNRFQNNPAAFLDFIGNAENREEAQKLGLLRDPAIVPAVVAVPDPPGKV